MSKTLALFVGLLALLLGPGANAQTKAGSDFKVAIASNGQADIQVLRSRIHFMQAESIADRLAQFTKENQNQVAWTTQLPLTAGSIDQRRFDALRLFRNAPAVTELSQLDSEGKEFLKVSRLAMDVVGSGTDYSKEAKFTETVAKKIYYGPVYLRGGSEPHVTLGLAGTRSDAGVSVAELNLNLMWEIVQQTKIGDHGVAYVVNADGRVIAHSDSDVSKSLRDFSSLAHVREARTAGCPESVRIAHDMNDREVVVVCARVAGLGWLVFVELPMEEWTKY
jgi:two-component system NtrC family sensor kinase